MAIELTKEKFNEFIKKGIVLIDFHAHWCLDPNTKLIFNPCINNIEKVKENSKILSFDKNFKESFVKVKSTYKILSNEKIKLITERGREIICTPEHLILTNNGFKKAEELSERDLISTYLFSLYPVISEDNRAILTEEMIKKTAESFGLNKDKYINELKDKKLLDLKYNDEKSYILASLIGFLLTDGSLSLQKNNLRLTEFFVGKEEDVSEITKDLNLIGYNPSFRYQEIKGNIAGREFVQKINRIRISKTSLFILMVSLGGIVGKKFEKGLKIPEWIISGPKEIQKAFLQGFLGGDGPKVTINTRKRKNKSKYNQSGINPIEFHFYSKAENSSEEFVKQISYLLKNFEIGTKKVEIKKEERYERKDKKISMLLKIYLKTNLQSAYNYASIGFKYSHTKKLSSSLAREYLMERLAKIKRREKKKLQAIQMKNKFSINEIAKKLNLSYHVIDNWLSGKRVFPPHDAITYEEWLMLYYKNGEKIIFDKIKTIKKHNGENYPFISLSLDNETKMFVANEVIHHNCMPCVMMSPIVDEVSKKFKEKIKVGKINVDENHDVAQKYNVRSIPTFIIFKDGKVAEQFVGAVSKEEMEQKIGNFLTSSSFQRRKTN